MSYDIKYRQRAIGYWQDGHSKRATAEVFKISTSTLQRWKSQLKETGELAPKECRETWRKIEPAKLKRFLEENPDAYLKEIADEFDCLDVAILKALRRLKISRKKLPCTRRLTRVFDNALLKRWIAYCQKTSYTLTKAESTSAFIENMPEPREAKRSLQKSADENSSVQI